MATLTVDVIDRATGLADPAGVAAAGGGDDFPNTGREFLKVANGGGGAITVTVNSTVACSLGFDHDEPAAASVGAGETRFFGPFPTSRYGTSAGVTYSGVTSVTVAAIRLPAN